LLHTALTNAGVSSIFIRLPNTGHTIPATQDAPAALWLAETLQAAGTNSLVVNNHSFELPIIAPGTFSATAAPIGWSVYGNGINFGGRTIGVLRPGTTTLYVEPVPDGNNVGLVFLLDNQANQTQFASIEAGLQQTLTATLQPMRRYTLRVEVGNIANIANGTFQFGGFPNYRIDLMAGASVIASDLNSLLPGEGRYLTSTITFAAAASNPLVGQPLGIRLVNLNNAPGIEVNFDNVRLTAEPILPPIIAFAPGLTPGTTQLTWPDPGGNLFVVETATDLADWTLQAGVPQLNAGLWSLSIPTPAASRRYYRLR
jgi:hapalindole H/12-epi-hapalindole U/12-epi-fischerindole U synthase